MGPCMTFKASMAFRLIETPFAVLMVTMADGECDDDDDADDDDDDADGDDDDDDADGHCTSALLTTVTATAAAAITPALLRASLARAGSPRGAMAW